MQSPWLILALMPTLFVTASYGWYAHTLFGGKTNYNLAQEAMDSTINLPSSFGQRTLAEEHEELLKESYEPIMLYLLGRHGTRYPRKCEVESWNAIVKEFQDIIRSEGVSEHKFKDILDWKPSFSLKLADMMSERGLIEQVELAKRWKSLYPVFFNAETADVKFGWTSSIRTAHSGIEFLKQVDGLEIEGVDMEAPLQVLKLEDPDFEDKYKFLHSHFLPLKEKFFFKPLEFHLQCREIHGRKFEVVPEKINKVRKVFLYERSFEKFGLSLDKYRFNPKEKKNLFMAIYFLCAFEMANYLKSVWCPLLDPEDLQSSEFMKDLRGYYEGSYGPNARSKQACPVIKDMIESIHDITKSGAGRPEKAKGHFYFLHSMNIKKLIGSFDLFHSDMGLTEENMDRFLQEVRAPTDSREYRTSFIFPFMANLGFVVYQHKGQPTQGTLGSRYKIMAILNERPVKLGGCDAIACDLDLFLLTYRDMLNCDLREICASTEGSLVEASRYLEESHDADS